MAQAQGQFSPINAGESEVFGFDFSNDLQSGDSITSISSVTLVQVGESAGAVDPTPSDRLDGAAFFAGTVASQRITNPVTNVVYKLTIFINTANGNVLDLWSYIVCVP